MNHIKKTKNFGTFLSRLSVYSLDRIRFVHVVRIQQLFKNENIYSVRQRQPTCCQKRHDKIPPPLPPLWHFLTVQVTSFT